MKGGKEERLGDMKAYEWSPSFVAFMFKSQINRPAYNGEA